MHPAHRDVLLVTADLHLFAGPQGPPCSIKSHYHGGFAATVTDGFDFFQLVQPASRCVLPSNRLALEVGAQTVGQYRDRQRVDDLGQLFHLCVS